MESWSIKLGKNKFTCKNMDIINKYTIKSIKNLYKNVKLLKKINNYKIKIN